MAPKGRPPKKKRNISGLKNQPAPSVIPIPSAIGESAGKNADKHYPSANPGELLPDDEEQDDQPPQDMKDLASSEQEDDPDSDFESDHEWKGLTSRELGKKLAELSCEIDEDPNDMDWIPYRLRRLKGKKKERPKTYMKGPDVMSKSVRSQQRHAKVFKDQTQLDAFFEARPTRSGSSIPQVRRVSDRSISSEESEDSVEVIRETYNISDGEDNREVSVGLSTVPESELTMGNSDNSASEEEELGDDDEEINLPSPERQAEEMEAWEEELEQDVSNPPTEIKDWATLRAQIKADLKKNAKKFALSELNKLMIICNFATLRIKGRSRIEARRFEHSRAITKYSNNFQSSIVVLLKDELVKKRILDFLQSLPTGKVTPKKLQVAVNTVILPALDITPKKPIGTRTARRWLIKLGWRYTQVKKGVYMDGHERDDVVKYRQDVFLPLMAKFEARMAHYEGPELRCVEPVLQPGEREIIPNFDDESTFHANEEVRSVWLRKGEQPLRKKGRGRLIHVSAFINPENGRLILLDEKGDVVRDSTKIIYPGSGGDAWWDCEQLLKQMEEAIQIFEAAHPGKQSLFIFDQSSAHASLPPDALKAFEMNKSDGGKQRRQQDTIIPETNPVEEHRGKPQSMTLPDGKPKGLQRVLEERGFNVQKLRAKCSPYWGWCKYRYREVDKKTFQDAKNAAKQYLEACPTEVIHRFINRSWRFMSAYRLGLTGHAAAWAVKKQKQHRQVSQRAMMSIEAVLNP
ncbi:uncharacterized protein LACBIDRAFT_330618 [Laccaria bicolor S238N-H82]|uniref:Predicted protein n=1 Tax=Laccaria bicolor (strain S238N-H82 / ATCC MYA-4686) TaxID=486041 RepID=B0DLX2_LACBS|nr:uncharacterized protein LACBIDRAFT_330618 [Laccaria bicolor S238N-H82]EDR04366.1 predicted protein [Laccaria bicolor S238N-H82]|eukprot:XP_001884885.1 predicted protein [Laccaria bicolor S238N-H82]